MAVMLLAVGLDLAGCSGNHHPSAASSSSASPKENTGPECTELKQIVREISAQATVHRIRCFMRGGKATVDVTMDDPGGSNMIDALFTSYFAGFTKHGYSGVTVNIKTGNGPGVTKTQSSSGAPQTHTNGVTDANCNKLITTVKQSPYANTITNVTCDIAGNTLDVYFDLDAQQMYPAAQSCLYLLGQQNHTGGTLQVYDRKFNSKTYPF